jgi:hypothetical protein
MSRIAQVTALRSLLLVTALAFAVISCGDTTTSADGPTTPAEQTPGQTTDAYCSSVSTILGRTGKLGDKAACTGSRCPRT